MSFSLKRICIEYSSSFFSNIGDSYLERFNFSAVQFLFCLVFGDWSVAITFVAALQYCVLVRFVNVSIAVIRC